MPVYINGKELGGAGSGATALDDLTDVSVSAPQPGDILEYSGLIWTNVAPTSGLGDSITTDASITLGSSDTFVNCETDVSGGSIVIDLPASMSAGQFHWIVDAGLNANVNNIIIDGNGNLINGQSQITIGNPGQELRVTAHTNENRWTIG